MYKWLPSELLDKAEAAAYRLFQGVDEGNDSLIADACEELMMTLSCVEKRDNLAMNALTGHFPNLIALCISIPRCVDWLRDMVDHQALHPEAESDARGFFHSIVETLKEKEADQAHPKAISAILTHTCNIYLEHLAGKFIVPGQMLELGNAVGKRMVSKGLAYETPIGKLLLRLYRQDSFEGAGGASFIWEGIAEEIGGQSSLAKACMGILELDKLLKFGLVELRPAFEAMLARKLSSVKHRNSDFLMCFLLISHPFGDLKDKLMVELGVSLEDGPLEACIKLAHMAGVTPYHYLNVPLQTLAPRDLAGLMRTAAHLDLARDAGCKIDEMPYELFGRKARLRKAAHTLSL
ncbi:hypothetical protein ACYPKM_05515 [Pseudomonas aeruginosa]